MNKVNIDYYGNNGIASDGANTISFSIMGSTDMLDIENYMKEYGNRFMAIGDRLKFLNYTIATHGIDNQLPYDVKNYIDHNPILPEILKKQVRIIYGQGHGLYISDETGEKKVRKWVTQNYPEVMTWLNNWEKDPELDPFRIYITRIIHEYYYMEGYYDHWLFNLSRRIGGNMPVRGLKAMNGTLCRLATTKNIDIRSRILDEDCDIVLEGDWRNMYYYDLIEWPRFNLSNPFQYPSAVHYVRDRGFNEDIYSNPTFFNGQKEWIKGSNLNPRYVNSYLKNSFNARIHVIIPDAWIKEKKTTLENICNENDKRKDASKKLIEEYEGIKVGTEFTYNMLTELINKKISQCVDMMSGQGENQGKMFWTRSFMTEHGIEQWKFEEIPSKYKEFVDSIISYNKTTNAMILAGKGMDPAISNLGNEGVFNSGSQVYYSYMVYLDSLQYAEDYICEDINRALWINFPRLERDGVRLGFHRAAPARQQDIAPADRMQNNFNNPPQ
jgi:hypothetical protein